MNVNDVFSINHFWLGPPSIVVIIRRVGGCTKKNFGRMFLNSTHSEDISHTKSNIEIKI